MKVASINIYKKLQVIEGTSAVKMAITNVDGIDNEISHFISFHSPNTQANYGHLEAIVECNCHFFWPSKLTHCNPVVCCSSCFVHGHGTS